MSWGLYGPSNPTGRGGFKKGQSGNPNGRKLSPEKEKFLAECTRLVPECLDIVSSIMRDKECHPMARLKSISMIFDYAMGKPKVQVEINDDRNDGSIIDQMTSEEVLTQIKMLEDNVKEKGH